MLSLAIALVVLFGLCVDQSAQEGEVQEIDGNGGFSLDSHSRGDDPPIAIYNNTQLISKAQLEGWTGSGTESDPYIIEDYDINGSNNHHCILVKDTDLHLVIENNTLHNVTRGSSDPVQAAAIHLEGVSNVTVAWNTFKDIDKPAHGIQLIDSDDVVIHDNNVTSEYQTIYVQSSSVDIINNSIGTRERGIHFSGSSGCLVKGNHIYNTRNVTGLYPYGITYTGSSRVWYTDYSLRVEKNSFHGLNNAASLQNGMISFTDNNVTDSIRGLYIADCYNSTISDNEFTNVSHGAMSFSVNTNLSILRNSMFGCMIRPDQSSFWENFSSHTFDGSNTINGVPISVMDGVNDTLVDKAYSEYILNDCHNVTLWDLTMPKHFGGIWSSRSSNITVVDVTAESSFSTKMRFMEMSDVRINNCTLENVTIDIYSYVGLHASGIEICDNSLEDCYLQLAKHEDILVTNNHIVNGERGIHSYSGTGGVYTRNNVTLTGSDLTQGAIHIDQSPAAVIRENALWGAGFKITKFRTAFSDNVFENNTLDGKPVLFMGNETDMVVEGDEWGQVIIGYCTNITLDGLSVEGTGENMEVSYSIGVHINDTRVIGARKAGIISQRCDDFTVSGCYVKDCGIGIRSRFDDGVTIVDNWVLNSTEDGILVEVGTDVSIERNVVMYNGRTGISAGTNLQSSGKVTRNYVSDNEYYGVLTAININVYRNSFIDNYRDPYTGNVRSPQCMDQRTNEWYIGSRGNFWSEYETRYPNAGNDGTVWDTPYEIKFNVFDNFPLVHPWDLIPPIADAGEDVEVVEGESFELNGSASYDNFEIVSYEWVLEDGSAGHHVYQCMTLSHHIDEISVWNATLIVKDRQGLEASDTIRINVSLNPPPFADAGEDIEVDEGTTVTLDGSGSTDSHGIVGWRWSFLYGGEDIDLVGQGVEFTFDLVGVYEVTLNVTDALGKWDADTLNVTVLDITLPTAEAGLDQTVDEGTEVTLSGLASSDNVGIASYRWSFRYDGSDVVLDGAEVQFLFTVPGEYEITLKVTDLSGLWHTDQVTVTVGDVTPPALDVHRPVEDELTRNAICDVSGSTEPFTRVDINIESTGGSKEYTLTSSQDGSFEMSIGLFEGVQNVVVTATDAAGNPSTASIVVTLDTVPPDFIINSPDSDYVVTRQSRYTIVGTMIYDPDATVFIHLFGIAHTGVFQHEVELEEGVNLIEVKAVDEAGNEKVVVLTIVRDSIAPFLTVTSPPEDYLITNYSTVHFEGTVTNAAGVMIQHRALDLPADLVAGSWEDGAWAFDLELGPTDLEQDVVIIAYDLAGNEAIMVIYVRYDFVPPPLWIDGEPLSYTNQTTVTISGTTEVGIETITVNGVEEVVVNGMISVEVDLQDGQNTFVISVQDEAGNLATETIQTFLDRVPPTYDIDYPKRSTKKKATVSGTCSDDVVTMWVNLRSIQVENGTYEMEVDLEKDGKNQFRITFVDRAGNTVTETITISKGEETPGFGAISSMLALTVLLLAAVALRRRE